MGKLAPILRGKRKLKMKPRGRPFKPGHLFGLATRFKPGNRANPGGRPSFAEVNKASRAWLAAKVPGDPYQRTGAEMIVEMLAGQALCGDRASAAELVDRAEGRPPIAISVDGAQDNLIELIQFMHAESARIGPPEGSYVEQKVLTDGE